MAKKSVSQVVVPKAQNAAGNGAAETSCIVYFLKKGKLM